MQEFATRTHQQGVAELAKDYRPAPIDQAVMPIRVEKWLGHGKIKYRVVGILWGGSRLLKALGSVSTRKKPTCAWILFRHYERPVELLVTCVDPQNCETLSDAASC